MLYRVCECITDLCVYIAIKPKAKYMYRFHLAAILLSYSAQKKKKHYLIKGTGHGQTNMNLRERRFFTRAFWKDRGLTLLLRVGTLWRCGDGVFLEVAPLGSDAILTTLHPFLENVPQTVNHFEISYLGAPFLWF
jgi:hypothetical protein